MGVRFLSKLSKLKKEAFQAGKKRNWDEAISIYRKILEIDKNNPTVINELGDICLKNGETAQAISHFITAASKYRQTGLLNNAVAIYKKVLRYDASNVSAHWYLGEIRASQGLIVEGQVHAEKFLASGDGMVGDSLESYLKRCRKLLEHYQESGDLLSRLYQVFSSRKMTLEAARTDLLRACLNYDAGEEEQARRMVATAMEEHSELSNYPEYTRWEKCCGSTGSRPTGNDVNSLALDHDDVAQTNPPTPEVSDPEPPRSPEEVGFTGAADSAAPPPTTDASATDEFDGLDLTIKRGGRQGESATDDTPGGFGEISIDSSPPIPAASESQDPADAAADMEDPGEVADSAGGGGVLPSDDIEAVITDDEGCIEIDIDLSEGMDLYDLVSDVEQQLTTGEAADPPQTAAAAPQNETQVDLLAEILAEESDDVETAEDRQLSTIASEISAQVGGEDGEDNPAGQYDMGMVYLEMDLFDQACACFENACASPDHIVRAHEMWGIALIRAKRTAEAVEVLQRGTELPVKGAREQLGILYQLGVAHYSLGNSAEARDFLERVHSIDSNFLDVGERLATLSTV